MILLFNFFISNDICLLINFFIYTGSKKIKQIFFINRYTFYFYHFFQCTLNNLLILLSPCHKSLRKKIQDSSGFKPRASSMSRNHCQMSHCIVSFSSSSSKFFPRLNSYREKYASKAEKIAEGAFSTFGPKCFILRKKIMT